ncbi:MAG: hypothetical protein M3463_12315 [Verrucomicrobiota bacterium]|nr:hypothetical protein [Verrucomicrobiota bacterium]
MSLAAVFRILLVASFIGAFAGLALQPLLAPHLPQDWTDVMAWDGNRGAINFENSHPYAMISALRVLGAVLILSVVAQIGLFVFWPPARLLYAAAVALSMAFELLVGLSVLPPWDSFFNAVTYACDGAILALAYASPLSERFGAAK